MLLGDSTTDANGTSDKVRGRLLSLFSKDSASINLIGTRGSFPNLHEGRSGRKTLDYVKTSLLGGKTNPFLNKNAFDFSYYMTQNNSFPNPDFVFIHLGLNDLYRGGSFGRGGSNDDKAIKVANTIITNLNTIITSIHNFNRNIKVVVCLPIHASSQDGAADDYGKTVYWRWKRSISIIQKALIIEFDTAVKRKYNIFTLGYHLNLDTENNFSKYSSGTYKGRHNNFLHPSQDGYNQMGDTIFGFIKFNME